MSPAKVLRNFDIAKASGTLHHTEKYIVDENGNFIIFNSIPVFCKQTLDNETFQLLYSIGWNPINRARCKYEWCYTPLNTHQVTSFSI